MNDTLAVNGGSPPPSWRAERQLELTRFWTEVLDQLKQHLEAQDDQPDDPTHGPDTDMPRGPDHT